MSDRLRNILNSVREGNLSVEAGLEEIKKSYYCDLEYALVDTHREIRKGFPEVIYGQGKTISQVVEIAKKLLETTTKNVLATRVDPECYLALRQEIPEAEYNETARLIIIRRGEQSRIGNIVVVSAGTTDLPVAEEAAATAEAMGNYVERLYDSGVAGLHRLLSRADKLFKAKVIIVVAGMDGALPSVVGGLVDKPVIAVPTSTGYGSSFGGLAALLAMLNSCAAGVGVVNIDNGFGAGYLASLINQQ